MRTQSCCLDYLWYNSNIDFTSLSTYLDFLVEESKQYSRKTCIDPLPLFTKNGYSPSTYFAVETCENGSSVHDQQLCSNDGSIDNILLPVIDSDLNIYKNQHCAKCNSVVAFEMLNVTVFCQDDIPSVTGCQIFLQLEEPDSIRQCFEKKRCEPGNVYYDLCYAFVGPINQYANYFCYLCENNVPVDQYELEYDMCGFGTILFGISWSYFLQFQNPIATEQKNVDKKCNSSKVLDALSDKCTSFFCPIGYEAADSSCKKKSSKLNINNVEGRNFDNCFNGHKNYLATINIDNRTTIVTDILGMSNSSEDIYQTFEYGVKSEVVNFLKVSISGTVSDLQTNAKYLKYDERIILSPYLSSLAFSHVMNASHMFPDHQYCSKSISLHSSSYTFTDECKIIYNDSVIERTNFTMWIEVKRSGSVRHVAICETFYMSTECPLRKLNANWTMLENKTLLQQKNDGTEKTYVPEEYTPLENGQYGVCIDTDTEITFFTWETSLEKAEIYLSTIGSSLSVLGYIMVITTFFCFKEIRNTPSFCAACLCLCLFFADGLFLVINAFSFFHVSTSEMTCSWMGILMHFCLLATQFWSVVMAVDIRCNATSVLMDRSIQKARLIKLAATAFSLSLLIVFTTNVFKHYEIFYVSYSQEKICALQGFYARIVFYAAPLLISLSISLILLCNYMLAISKEIKVAKLSLGNRYGNCISLGKIALKLIVIFGLSELSGFVSIHKDVLSRDELIFNYAFRILYSIARGFRGVMLFVVYVYRKPVLMLVRKHITMRTTRLERSSHPSNPENM